MIKARSPQCPRCQVSLVLANEPGAFTSATETIADHHWTCPACGSVRPIVYLVTRTQKQAS